MIRRGQDYVARCWLSHCPYICIPWDCVKQSVTGIKWKENTIFFFCQDSIVLSAWKSSISPSDRSFSLSLSVSVSLLLIPWLMKWKMHSNGVSRKKSSPKSSCDSEWSEWPNWMDRPLEKEIVRPHIGKGERATTMAMVMVSTKKKDSNKIYAFNKNEIKRKIKVVAGKLLQINYTGRTIWYVGTSTHSLSLSCSF